MDVLASASSTLVVVEAVGTDAPSCEVRVGGAREQSLTGSWTAVDQRPAPVSVRPGTGATFALAFLRPVSAAERSAPVTVDLAIARSTAGEPASFTDAVLVGACDAR